MFRIPNGDTELNTKCFYLHDPQNVPSVLESKVTFRLTDRKASQMLSRGDLAPHQLQTQDILFDSNEVSNMCLSCYKKKCEKQTPNPHHIINYLTLTPVSHI